MVNTRPKLGLVFHMFRGHVMGIPADYRDADYMVKVPLLPKVSMLCLTKEHCRSVLEEVQKGAPQLGSDQQNKTNRIKGLP